MSDWNFVAAAYGVTWVMLLGYGLYLSARARAVVRAENDRRALEGAE